MCELYQAMACVFRDLYIQCMYKYTVLNVLMFAIVLIFAMP